MVQKIQFLHLSAGQVRSGIASCAKYQNAKDWLLGFDNRRLLTFFSFNYSYLIQFATPQKHNDLQSDLYIYGKILSKTFPRKNNKKFVIFFLNLCCSLIIHYLFFSQLCNFGLGCLVRPTDRLIILVFFFLFFGLVLVLCTFFFTRTKNLPVVIFLLYFKVVFCFFLESRFCVCFIIICLSM